MQPVGENPKIDKMCPNCDAESTVSIDHTGEPT